MVRSFRFRAQLQNGFTLVEMLVAIALLGIITLAFTTMLFNQARATQAVTEKLAAQDTSRSIITALSSAPTCNKLLAPANMLTSGTIPPGVSPSNPFQILLAKVPLSADGAVSINPGTAPSALSNNLVLNPSSDPTSPGVMLSVTSSNSGYLWVNFDQSRLIMPLHNLSFPINIQTNGSGGIVGCLGGVSNKLGGTKVFSTAGSYSWVVPQGVSSIRVTVIGGGGGGQGTRPTLPMGPGNPTGTGSVGMGGTGGASVVAIINVAEGVTFPITVGAGGAGGGPGSVGTPGSASSFGGSMIVAPGGMNGGPGAGVPAPAKLPFVEGPFAPFVPQANPTYDPNINVLIANPDTQGTAALAASCSNILGGSGGPGFWGGAGASTAAEADGAPAQGYGGGGSGGASSCGFGTKSGGAGHDGAVLIEW